MLQKLQPSFSRKASLFPKSDISMSEKVQSPTQQQATPRSLSPTLSAGNTRRELIPERYKTKVKAKPETPAATSMIDNSDILIDV